MMGGLSKEERERFSKDVLQVQRLYVEERSTMGAVGAHRSGSARTSWLTLFFINWQQVLKIERDRSWTPGIGSPMITEADKRAEPPAVQSSAAFQDRRTQSARTSCREPSLLETDGAALLPRKMESAKGLGSQFGLYGPHAQEQHQHEPQHRPAPKGDSSRARPASVSDNRCRANATPSCSQLPADGWASGTRRHHSLTRWHLPEG